MKTKINQDQQESEPQTDSEKQNELEQQLVETIKENQLLREMTNLKSDEYYRLQVISSLAKISDSLSIMAEAQTK